MEAMVKCKHFRDTKTNYLQVWSNRSKENNVYKSFNFYVGNSCPLSIYLANLGIGNIGIVDDDKVELSNLIGRLF